MSKTQLCLDNKALDPNIKPSPTQYMSQNSDLEENHRYVPLAHLPCWIGDSAKISLICAICSAISRPVCVLILYLLLVLFCSIHPLNTSRSKGPLLRGPFFLRPQYTKAETTSVNKKKCLI
jgi:hypothetical protein